MMFFSGYCTQKLQYTQQMLLHIDCCLASTRLPYRMIYAVVSEDALFLYDTQQPQPFAYLANLHYHTLSDATWYALEFSFMPL